MPKTCFHIDCASSGPLENHRHGLVIVPLHLEVGHPAVPLGGFDPGMSQEVLWHEGRCIHCTGCVAPILTKALDVLDRQMMVMAFDRECCIACEICLKVCPYQTMEIPFG